MKTVRLAACPGSACKRQSGIGCIMNWIHNFRKSIQFELSGSLSACRSF